MGLDNVLLPNLWFILARAELGHSKKKIAHGQGQGQGPDLNHALSHALAPNPPLLFHCEQ